MAGLNKGHNMAGLNEGTCHRNEEHKPNDCGQMIIIRLMSIVWAGNRQNGHKIFQVESLSSHSKPHLHPRRNRI